MKQGVRSPLVVAALATALSAPVWAHAGELPLWEVGGGAAAISFPAYRGSDQQRNYLLPLPYFVYRGEVLQVDREKIRGLLFRTERVELDISVNGSVPVRSNDIDARHGMPNLDPTLEIGPSLNIALIRSQPLRLTFRLPVRAAIASDFHSVHGAGVLSHPQLGLDIKTEQGWNVGFVAGPLFADRKYHDYFYSVAPQYATAARPAYQAKGGYSGLQLVTGVSRRFADLWLGAFVKYDRVGGAAFADSPLVERRNNLSAGVSATWIFARSQRRVEKSE